MKLHPLLTRLVVVSLLSLGMVVLAGCDDSASSTSETPPGEPDTQSPDGAQGEDGGEEPGPGTGDTGAEATGEDSGSSTDPGPDEQDISVPDTPSDQEAGNTPGAASTLEIGVPLTEALEPTGDVDWFAFEATAGQILWLQVEAQGLDLAEHVRADEHRDPVVEGQ